jgi:hypothetical protein
MITVTELKGVRSTLYVIFSGSMVRDKSFCG